MAAQISETTAPNTAGLPDTAGLKELKPALLSKNLGSDNKEKFALEKRTSPTTPSTPAGSITETAKQKNDLSVDLSIDGSHITPEQLTQLKMELLKLRSENQQLRLSEEQAKKDREEALNQKAEAEKENEDVLERNREEFKRLVACHAETDAMNAKIKSQMKKNEEVFKSLQDKGAAETLNLVQVAERHLGLQQENTILKQQNELFRSELQAAQEKKTKVELAGNSGSNVSDSSAPQFHSPIHSPNPKSSTQTSLQASLENRKEESEDTRERDKREREELGEALRSLFPAEALDQDAADITVDKLQKRIADLNAKERQFEALIEKLKKNERTQEKLKQLIGGLHKELKCGMVSRTPSETPSKESVDSLRTPTKASTNPSLGFVTPLKMQSLSAELAEAPKIQNEKMVLDVQLENQLQNQLEEIIREVGPLTVGISEYWKTIAEKEKLLKAYETAIEQLQKEQQELKEKAETDLKAQAKEFQKKQVQESSSREQELLALRTWKEEQEALIAGQRQALAQAKTKILELGTQVSRLKDIETLNLELNQKIKACLQKEKGHGTAIEQMTTRLNQAGRALQEHQDLNRKQGLELKDTADKLKAEIDKGAKAGHYFYETSEKMKRDHAATVKDLKSKMAELQIQLQIQTQSREEFQKSLLARTSTPSKQEANDLEELKSLKERVLLLSRDKIRLLGEHAEVHRTLLISFSRAKNPQSHSDFSLANQMKQENTTGHSKK